MSKIWTDEEKLKEFGTTDDKEIMEILNHREESEKESQKLADEAYDEMVRQGLIKEEDYGYYEDENGNEEYDENLKELDSLNNNAIKKVKEDKKVKEKLYLKDDIKEGFDITTFDYNFKNIYGDIIERDFKIYHFLKHHFSYGRTKLVRDMFSQEERCIKNFMEIEEIVYKRPDGVDSNLTEGYYIPFTKSIKSYGDTFDIIKSYKTKLIKLISEYDTNRINHDVLMFKSDFQLIHKLKMKEFKEILIKPEE